LQLAYNPNACRTKASPWPIGSKLKAEILAAQKRWNVRPEKTSQ